MTSHAPRAMSGKGAAWRRNTQGDLKYKFPTFLEDAKEAVEDKQTAHSAPRPSLEDARRSSGRFDAARREMEAISDQGSSHHGSSHSLERVSNHRLPSSGPASSHHGSASSFHKQRRDGGESSGGGSFERALGVNAGRRQGGGGGGCCGGRQRPEEVMGEVVRVTTAKLERMERQQREFQQKQDATAAHIQELNSTMDRIIGGQAELAQLKKQVLKL